MDFKVLRWPKCLKDIYFMRGLKEEKGIDAAEYQMIVKKFDKLVEDEPAAEIDDYDMGNYYEEKYNRDDYDYQINEESY